MRGDERNVLAQFIGDCARHTLKILRDDGVYRHLRYSEPGTCIAAVDVITYPGGLLYRGDMGAFVFERLEDMFQFFRTPEDRQISFGYWAEKIAASCGDGVREFDDEEFTRAIMGDLVQWIRSNRDRTTKEERRDLWYDVVFSVIEAEGDGQGMRKQIAAHDFRRYVNRDTSFHFSDLYERSFEAYTQRFLWCCFALVRIINLYDESKS